ncbi:MAG TPA: ATP-binding protein [Kofleriaceae bacterium]|nr:ATP-binding protein [Kofleriaceae bacterium]
MTAAATRHDGKRALAYELRRISDQLIARVDDAPRCDARQGPLATQLATAFELDRLEVDLALVVLGAAIDADIAELLRVVTNGATGELATVAALVPVLESRLVTAGIAGPESRLVRKRVLRTAGGRLDVTRRFRAAALGHHVLARLPGYARRVSSGSVEMPWLVDPRTVAAAMWRDRPPSALCIVGGAAGSGKTTWARSLALSMSKPALYVDLAAAAAMARDPADDICELVDDAALAGFAVVLDNGEGLVGTGTRFAAILASALDEVAAQVVLVVDDTERADARLTGRAAVRVEVTAPPAQDRRALWSANGVDDTQIALLAEDLVLTPRQIENAAALVRAGFDPVAAAIQQLPARGALTMPDRELTRLDMLVLPTETRDEIIEIIGAIRSRSYVLHDWNLSCGRRGQAISALFDGDSGTGKTLACDVVAAEVGLPLMRVDVATLVDKYVGETEKNLTRVFEEARTRGGILFFDEADALFGSRTDGTRAQDRYANLATNLLLQLMERFTGVVLLTTNLKRNIDPAFMRRITYKVYFDPPELAEREQLWRMHLPIVACDRNVDVQQLAASFELNGGSIRAAAMRAAYRAAASERRIDMADLVDCAKLEAAGMGRVATF